MRKARQKPSVFLLRKQEEGSPPRECAARHGVFRRLPSPSCSVGCDCDCGLWAERHRCSVTRLGSARRPARRLDSAARRGSAACRRRLLRSAAPRGDSAQLGGSARLPASAARRLGGAAFAPSAPIAPPAPSALSAPSRPPRPPCPPRRLNCRPPSSARSGAPAPRGAALAARARHQRCLPRERRRWPVLCARGARRRRWRRLARPRGVWRAARGASAGPTPTRTWRTTPTSMANLRRCSHGAVLPSLPPIAPLRAWPSLRRRRPQPQHRVFGEF